MNEASSRPPISPLIAFAWGILAVSSGSTFARQALQYASPLVVSAYRLGIATLILFPIVMPRFRQELRTLQRRELILAGFSGVFLHFILLPGFLR